MPRTTRQLHLDMLANMADDWSDTTSAMISITVGLVMRELGITEVEVPLSGLTEFMTKYTIDRSYFDRDDKQMMRVTVTER